MNKAELVEAIAQRGDLDTKSADAALRAFVDAVVEATSAGDKVAITGFGSFHPTNRAARTGRNPRTGEAVDIPASRGVRFSPGAAFKAVLNPGGQ